MKTITRNFLLAALVMGTTLSLSVSCVNDPGMHYSQFVYPNSQSNPYYYGYMPVYADQPTDSIAFATTENWTLRTDYYGSGKGWLVIPAELQSSNFKIEPYTVYYMGGAVNFSPNTTGNKRRVLITLDAGDYDCNSGFIQLPYLNITRPYRYVITTETLTPLESRDSLATLYALAKTEQGEPWRDSICFTVHGDWKLTPKYGQWITLERTAGSPGKHAVKFTLEPNTSTSSRTDTLYLSTHGVGNENSDIIVDTITITQRASN